MTSNTDDDDFKPTLAPGYKIAPDKTVEQLAQLDAEDESLKRWKESLGVTADSTAPAEGPKVTVLELELVSKSLPPGKRIILNITDKVSLDQAKKNPITIKEGVEYNHAIQSQSFYSFGIRYIQVVKRAGVKVDKIEQMLGSYGIAPDGEPYTKTFDAEESPSGLIARSGTYSVKSRVIDDDDNVYADFEWSFKLAKEW